MPVFYLPDDDFRVFPHPDQAEPSGLIAISTDLHEDRTLMAYANGMFPWFEDAGGNDKAVAFSIGFVVGLAVCSILLSTVASGVNTVIVMFADAPADLQQNYPEISQKMRTIWSEIYPGSV